MTLRENEYLKRFLSPERYRRFQEGLPDGPAEVGTATAQPQRPRRQPRGPAKPVPRDQWPRAARALATLAKPGDKGLGDVATRLIGHLGGEAFKRLFVKIVGRDCGCNARAARLNVLYPL